MHQVYLLPYRGSVLDPANKEDNMTQEIKIIGHLTAGPRFTGNACTGAWLRIPGDDALNLALQTRGVRFVQLRPGTEGISVVPTFNPDADGAYRLQRKAAEALYVEVPRLHCPDQLVDAVSSKPIGSSLTLPAGMLPYGTIVISLPKRG